MSKRWNPRFLMYCGKEDPGSVLVRDGEVYPGGIMTGFILWSAKRLAEYRAINPDAFLFGTLVGHTAYDEWLKHRETW